MSEENVESFSRGIDAINRRDVEACLETMQPEVSFAPIRSQIEGVYRGHAGVRRWFADSVESFESFRVNPTEIRDLGDNRLLMIGTLHLRARGSGIETDLATAGIAVHRDGLLLDWKDYGDSQKVLEAAGLSE
jgi:ketosteroid isomerase-like protein